MAPSVQTRNKAVKKPPEVNSKATKTAPIPDRRATSTPPPTVVPIAGTPFSPPNTGPATSSNTTTTPETVLSKTPVEAAQEALKIAFDHLTEQYQKTLSKQKQDPGVTTVETPVNVFAEIGFQVQNAIAQLSKQATHSDELKEHFARLEKTLKETITSTTTKTYAQAAATPSPERNRTNEIQQRNLERKVQKRREDAKLEITLTMQGTDPDTKEQFAQQPHSEITAKLQQIAESQLKDKHPIIQGIQKLKSQDIRIHCNTREEAEQLRNIEWTKAYHGLTVRRAKFGITIPGVPVDMVDPNNLQDSKLLKELEEKNKGLEIVGIKLLRRKLKDDAPFFTLVIFFSSPEMADRCIKHGIYIKHMRLHAQKYAPQLQLIQCYKCQQFGHHATKCRSLHEVCAKCSEHHPTSQCLSEKHKCAGCKGEHPAWHHDCPNKVKAIQNLLIRKREATAYFNEE